MKLPASRAAPKSSHRLRRTAARWWARPTHVLAGFWQKSSGWALPRDQRGEGYWRLARENTASVGFCLLFVFASAWGQTFLLSIFQPYWMRELQLDPAAMGMIYGGATLASGLLLPWAGRWLDRTSAVRAASVTLLGLAAFSLLAGAANSAALLAIALFGLRFFGQGLSANVGTVNAARWFEHNRGKAVSLAALGFPLGEALLPILVTVGAVTLGWRATWCILAGVAAFVFLPLARTLAARHPGAGESPEGDELDADRDDAGPGPEPRPLLRDWRFHAMLGVIAPLPFIATGIIFFQAEMAGQRGWNSAIFATGFLLFALVRAACSLSAGAWVDRIGAMRLLAVPPFAAAVGLAFLLRPEPGYAYLFFAALGLAFGSSSAITTAAWAEIFGTDELGAIRGLSSSVAIFLTAAAPICFGVLLERGTAMETILLACALPILGLAWPCSIALRRARHVR